MQKTYKKVMKAFNAYEVAYHECRDAMLAEYRKVAENALNLAKASKALRKACDAIGVSVDEFDMHAYGKGEDNFVRWCILNNIDYVDNTCRPDEESDEESDDETDE